MTIIEICSCLYARGDLLRAPFAYVQSTSLLRSAVACVHDWVTSLLVCNPAIIEFLFCLCADRLLFMYAFAYVQFYYYWTFWLLVCNKILVEYPLLLMCREIFIELLLCLCALLFLLRPFFCLYAKVKLLRNSFAFVQYEYYWVPPLLIVQSRFYWISRLLRCNHLLTCRKTLIDTISCLDSSRWLFNISYCLCARVILLNIFLACVQWPTYWLSWLLACRRNVIEYFVLSLIHIWRCRRRG